MSPTTSYLKQNKTNKKKKAKGLPPFLSYFWLAAAAALAAAAVCYSEFHPIFDLLFSAPLLPLTLSRSLSLSLPPRPGLRLVVLVGTFPTRLLSQNFLYLFNFLPSSLFIGVCVSIPHLHRL
ncbi:hypothetical protein CBS115989_10861 [Aspergillus niger]|nr:hypothetical protein CBS115989_10861 [Aspergillus niger]KAI2834368.1 hypothetical protein CBS11232_10843 [Aspergillus niger]